MMNMSLYHRRKPRRAKQQLLQQSNPRESSGAGTCSTSSASTVGVASIPEGQAKCFGPQHNRSSDSVQNEDGFLLPFDDDIDELSSPATVTTNTCSRRPTPSKKHQEQQQNRHAAMARLEEFFLGGVMEFAGGGGDASPVSVQDLDKREPTTTTKEAVKTSSPKRNMFGQVMDTQQRAPLVPPLGCGRPESQQFIKPEEPSMSLLTKEHQAPSLLENFETELEEPPHDHSFVLLKKGDRANSLPIECTMSGSSSCQSFAKLTKKPSLKKISSIGRLPSTKSEGNLKRTVSFKSLQIREYNVALSDHPSCSFGPPVGLSWDYNEKEEVCLESYEESRMPRRGVESLALSYYDRRHMLIKQAGYSKREVKAAVKEVDRVKRERMVTDLFLPASPLDETVEAVVATVKKLFRQESL